MSPAERSNKPAPEHWSREEVEAVVADYFHMLTLELAGQSYVKSAHRRALKAQLRGRSDSSIERKHQNISAILIEARCPPIPGYKPLGNYQRLLAEVVLERLVSDRKFDECALNAVSMPATTPLLPDAAPVLEEAPLLNGELRQEIGPYAVRRQGVFRDYLEREAQNRSLGLAGEIFAAEFEQRRLHAAGYARLAERVEHVAASRGDGLGYDILSFDVSGQERLIEVKTTAFTKETPFYLSKNELELSEAVPEQYCLYRLFEFRKKPRLFSLSGSVRQRCLLDPVTFRASFQ